MQKILSLVFLCCLLGGTLFAQTVTPWLTRGNQSVLLTQQTTTSFNTNTSTTSATITINGSNTEQTIDGFGFMLTQASAQVINGLSSTRQNQLLQELFGSNGLGISVLRISIGASDLSSSLYTYNQTSGDVNMNNFSLNGPDKTHLIPILKKILAINPNIKILATPWTAPTWMKTNNTWIGGSLRTDRYAAYALYFVRYLQAMDAEGISIWAITPQNEPLNLTNEPSMGMTSAQQKSFINNHLGPQLANSGYSPKIIAYDHNCDNTSYPIDVLNGSSYVDGAAFHLYDPGANIGAMSVVRNATGKNVYFTEQFTSSNGNFEGDFDWHMRNVVLGSLNNWSKTVIEWNLAANSSNGPNLPGGCTTCLPAITIPNSTSYSRNVSYYIIGQVARFIKPGAQRVNSSNNNGQLHSATFRNPDGQMVVVAYNGQSSNLAVRVRDGNRAFNYTISGKSAVTFTWTPSGGGSTGFSGFYNIVSRRSNKGLDVANFSTAQNANVQQYQISNGGGDNQRWEFIDAGGGYYRIRVKHSNKCLAIASSTSTNVIQQNCNTFNRLQWKPIDVGSGFFALENRASGRRLHVSNNSTSNGANIQVWSVNNNSNQEWRFNQVSSASNRLAPTQVQSEVGMQAEEVELFPNPADNELTVNLPEVHDFSSATLFDATGRQLFDTPVKPAMIQLEFDLGALPAGLYFLHFNSPTQHVVKRLIKN